MARPLRIEYEGAVYHITSRGNAREKIFFADSDRMAFLEIFAEVIDRYGWICHAYCLMTNHYHLVIETPEPNLSRGMRHLNGVYTQWINRHNNRTGHIFQGRFKSILVEKENYLLELTRYVVLNPVRAGMVTSPKDWRWSSYRATVGREVAPSFLTTEWILEQFDSDPSRAIRAYVQFVKQGHGCNLWEDLRRGNLLGTDAFVEQIAPLVNEQITATEIPRQQRLAARPTLEILFTDMHDKASRNEQIYKAVRVHKYTLKKVADFLGLYYSTISVIAKRIDEEKKHQE
jgi:REP element-mobilizing transposase RayT